MKELHQAIPAPGSNAGPSAPRGVLRPRAIHHGYDPLSHQGALNPPVYMSSTFAFETAEAGGQAFAGERPGYIYSRIANPTLDLLERRLAALEGAEAALSTASGMGAITSTLWTLLSPGDEIIVDKTLYGCTFAFMRHGLRRFGVRVRHVDLTEPGNLAAALGASTRLVYFETPANPNMRLVDIAAIVAIARSRGVRVIVDNTYATPYLTRPLECGADLVIHSATKYLGGHGDLTAGCVAGPAELIEQIRLVGLKDMSGAVLSSPGRAVDPARAEDAGTAHGAPLRHGGKAGGLAGRPSGRGRGILSGLAGLSATCAGQTADGALRRHDRL